MDDEVFVIGEPEAEETEQPPPRKWWLILLAVSLIGAVAVATRPDPEPDPEVPTPALPSSVTQVEAPRAATVVDQTLEWEQADGFEGLVSLGGVVNFDGAWWAVGSDEDGLAAWSNPSDDPAGPWELASRFGDAHATLSVRSVEAVGDELVTVATGSSTGAMFTSPDGHQWTERTLPDTEDGLETLPIQVIATDAGPVVYGGPNPSVASEEIAASLPEEWSGLVEDGLASANMGDSTVTIWVHPGIEVARFTAEELGLDPVPAPADLELVAWHGPDLDDLEATTIDEAISPWLMETSNSGSVFAMVGNRVGTSVDGLEWDRSLTGGVAGSPVHGFAPWKEGVVIIGSPGDDLIFWDPAIDEREDLPIPDLGGSEVALGRPVAGAVGLALIAFETDRAQDEPQPTLVESEGDRQLFYLDNGYVQYVEGGVEVGRQPIFQGTIDLDVEERELAFDNDGTEFIRVPIELWVEAVERAFRQALPGENLRVLHTRDGSEWSVEPWDEITGLDLPGFGGLFAAGDFLVAVAIGEGVAAEGVWVAQPLE